MARTVGLTAAAGVELMLSDQRPPGGTSGLLLQFLVRQVPVVAEAEEQN